jgi:hypothetical protein
MDDEVDYDSCHSSDEEEQQQQRRRQQEVLVIPHVEEKAEPQPQEELSRFEPKPEPSYEELFLAKTRKEQELEIIRMVEENRKLRFFYLVKVMLLLL